MAGDSPADIKKALKLYTLIGGVLFIGTIMTVAVAVVPALDWGDRGFSTGDLVIGLLIASVKASLVMYIFMHLNHEKKLIYLFYGMAGFFALCLYFITKMAYVDPIKYDGFGLGAPVVEKVEKH